MREWLWKSDKKWIRKSGKMIDQKYLNRKRYIDTLLTLIGLIVLSPVFLILVVAIKVDSPGSVLFRQKRIGLYKKHFDILKFRTMRTDTPKDTPTHLLENPDQYITKVGKFMRKTSLDELPQIINILRGDMAVIGDGGIIETTRKNLDFTQVLDA